MVGRKLPVCDAVKFPEPPQGLAKSVADTCSGQSELLRHFDMHLSFHDTSVQDKALIVREFFQGSVQPADFIFILLLFLLQQNEKGVRFAPVGIQDVITVFLMLHW